MSSQIDRSNRTRTWMVRPVGMLIGTALLVLGIPTAAQAAPAAPTVHIEDGGDGFLNATEVGAVMLTGTYDASDPSITGVVARIVNDATCADVPGASVAAVLDPGTGTWTAGPFDLSDDLLFAQDAAVCARARATDGVTPSDVAFSDNTPVKDTVAPAAPVISSPADASVLESTAVSVVGTAEPDSSVSVSDSGSPAGTILADVAGDWTLDLTLAEGAHSLVASATDAAGNTGADSSTVNVTVDIPPPPVTFETVVHGAINDEETGHVDTVLNSSETADGTALTVRLDISPDVAGVVTGRVTVRDANNALVTAQKSMEAAGSEESRTIALDVTSLQQGAIRVIGRVTDSNATVATQTTHLTLDLGAPFTTWATEDEDSFITLAPPWAIPFIGPMSFSTVSFAGTTGDPSGLSGVQWVYLVGKEVGGGREWGRTARLASREAPTTEWSLSLPIPAGEWEVTARSQDTAGNVDPGPSIRIFVDGT